MVVSTLNEVTITVMAPQEERPDRFYRHSNAKDFQKGAITTPNK